MTRRIEVVGQLGDTPITAEQITTLLDSATAITTRHGDTFTGRPATRLLVSPSHIIKQRTEYQIKEKDARRFITQAIERERKLGIYHSSKTWFLIFDEAAEFPLIANITARLTPLNDLDSLTPAITAARYTELLGEMFQLYLETAAHHDLSLDISLSNFALDAGQKLYYIDDDVYAWDRFTTFSHYLGVLLRTQERIDVETARQLGRQLHHALLDNFGDKLWLNVVAEEARSLFLPEARREVMRALLKALTEDARGRVRTQLPASTVVALLADIHANAPALEAALKYLQQRNINDILVMGDIVGYGPHPQQCIDILRALPGARVLQGNHDHAVATQRYSLGFSPVSRWVIEWSRERLSAEAISWLDGLPLYLQGDDWIAVHGAPNDKTFFNAYVYEMTYEDNLVNMESRNLHLCFHGHTHLQKVYYRKKNLDSSNNAAHQNMNGYERALVCPGSVGQPRSGRPGVEFALFDRQSGELEFMHLECDLSVTLRDMNSYNFPPNLIDRLSRGR
jgi:predicted phosphodiesterase